jgi:predicted nucleotidyltransferase
MSVYPHHERAIERVVELFREEADVEAVLLGGSVAHGFARPDSDIDVVIVVSDEDFAARQRDGRLHFYDAELAAYPGGYVDGKYVTAGFLRSVAEKGSEPARFAFKDSRILYSRLDGLEEIVGRIASYPTEAKADRLLRFEAQFEAWHWYAGEALRLGNQYLLGVAVAKLVLFGGRMILAHNELLYPYHKWFLGALESAPDRPADLMAIIADLYASPTAENVERFYESIKGFREWSSAETPWPVQFMMDSELNWTEGSTPVDDL